jgi:HPt (histidine-containing phosphotransfer) domain-containing protein
MLEGQDAETGALPELAGLEVAEALARLGVDPASYVELLRRFGPQADRDLEVLAAAVSAHDAEGTRRLAHALAGAAANLGAARLQRAARALERAAASGGTDLGALAAEVAREGRTVLASVASLTPPAPGPGPEDDASLPATADTAALRSALHVLSGCLAEADLSGATAALAAARAAGTPAPLRPVMAQLAQRVKQYEFAEAGAVVGRLLAALAEHP